MWLILAAVVPCAQGQSILNFPRLSFESGFFTGLAISNPGDLDAVVTLTAYGADGVPLAAQFNPASLQVGARQQVARLASELFGTPADPSAVAWIQATSPVQGLTGFFLYLNASLTLMDGADLPESGRKIVFNRVMVGSGRATELNIINPGESKATLQLQLIGPDSAPLLKSLLIPPRGVARLDVGSFFEVTEVPLASYVSVTSDLRVAGFEFVSPIGGDSLGLNAESLAEQMSTLYFPQMLVLGPWKSEVGLINYSSQPVIITLTAFKPDGTLYDAANLESNPVTRSLDVGGSLFADVAELFGFFGNEPLEGWILVQSTSAAINGLISYGVPSTGSWASVTGTAKRQTRALLSHIVTTGGLFTGIAVLNSGALASNIRVLALRPTGEILGSLDTLLQPGQRFSRLIHQLIPESGGQTAGLIWVKSDLPVHMTALFGNVNALANIPPQEVSDEYLPDRDLTFLRVKPPLAILQPGGSQRFALEGPQTGVVWKVNDTVGGNEIYGTIGSDGTYRAPAVPPAPQLVIVSAETENQKVGASVDVLEKNALLGSVQIVQSVAYLGSLEKLYTAELALLSTTRNAMVVSGDSALASGAVPVAETVNSEIFEVASDGVKTSLASYGNEVISKMLPYRASNGKEYLLLAAKTTGRIIRLDPVVQESADVVMGLTEPSAMVLDAVTGNLLVAERDKVTSIPTSLLESGLVSSARSGPDDRGEQPVAVFSSDHAGGVAVDSCTGNIYISNPVQGQILEYLRYSHRLRVRYSGLEQPGQLLAVYRKGVACPDSFQLLVSEPGSGEVRLIASSQGVVSRWVEAPGNTDLIFLPRGTPFVPSQAVLLTEAVESTQVTLAAGGKFSVVAVPVKDTYEEDPDNKMGGQNCPGRIIFRDDKLDGTIRAALNLGPDDPITCEAVSTVKELSLAGKGIENVSGLDLFTNLRVLLLGDNSIKNISPLSDLENLEILDLSNNGIRNIRPLAALTNLTDINLESNEMTDIRALLFNGGLGEGDSINVRSNKLGPDDCSDIQSLAERNVRILKDFDCRSDDRTRKRDVGASIGRGGGGGGGGDTEKADLKVNRLKDSASLTSRCSGTGKASGCPEYDVTLTATVSNVGKELAKSVRVKFEFSSGGSFSSLASVSAGNISADGSAEAKTTWKNVAPATYRIKVTLDPEDKVSESNEANNTETFSVRVGD